MAISVKHAFQSEKGDGTDLTLVQPSNWNAEHNILMDADNLLGRATAGNGAAEQIPCTSVSRGLLAQATAALWRTALGLGTAAVEAAGTFLAAANNLSDLPSASTARTNLGLGTYAVADVGEGEIVAKTSSYTLALTDKGKLITMGGSSAMVLTIPLNSSVEFPIGSEVHWMHTGTGALSFDVESGSVTLIALDDILTSLGRGAMGTLKKIDTNTWGLAGGLG